MTHILRPDVKMTYCNKEIDKHCESLDAVLEDKPDVCSFCALKVIELLKIEKDEPKRWKNLRV